MSSSKVNGISNILKNIVEREMTEGAQIALFTLVNPHHITLFRQECICSRHKDQNYEEIEGAMKEMGIDKSPLSTEIYRIAGSLFHLGVDIIRREREEREPPTPLPHKKVYRKKEREGEEMKGVISI